MAVKPVPDGFHTITPHLACKNTAAAIDFYKKAFGAEEIMRMPGPDGRSIMHAEMKIGNSLFMLADEWPEAGCKSPQSLGATTCSLHLYVENCDASYDRAVKAGAKPTMPLMDAFWGDRFGKVTDPFGHEWAIATHQQDLSPEQIAKNAEEWMKHACGPK